MNPEEEYLRQLQLDKPHLFKNTSDLQIYLSQYGDYQYGSEEVLQSVIDRIDFSKPAVVVEGPEDDPQKKKDVLGLGTELQSTSEEEKSSLDLTTKRNKLRTQNILNFISNTESERDPNRFRDDHLSEEKGKYNFTEMSIGEVLAWQESHKDDKGRYKAVGKYQFMPDTLKEFAEKSGIGLGGQFSSDNQDLLTIAMLNEGGLQEFLKDPDNNKEKMLETLSRRFASIPLTYNTTINGKVKKRGDSRYGGSNKPLVSPLQLEEMLGVIPDVINFREGKNAKEYYEELEEKVNRRKRFGAVTTSFLEKIQENAGIFGSLEKNVETELTRLYGPMGFKFSQAKAGSNAVIITAPDGQTVSEPIYLPGYVEGIQDIAAGISDAVGMTDGEEYTESEITSQSAATEIRKFMQDNYDDPIFRHMTDFSLKPIETAQQIFDSNVSITPSILDTASLEINELRMKQEGMNKFLPGSSSGYGGMNVQQVNPAWLAIEEQIKEKKGLLQAREEQVKRASQTVGKLIQEMGGVDFFVEDVQHGDKYLEQLMTRGLLRPEDINYGIVKIDEEPVSLDFLESVLTDMDMRQAYYNNEFSIEIDETVIRPEKGIISDTQKEVLKRANYVMEKQLHDNTWFSEDGKLPYYMNQVVGPLLGSLVDRGSKIGYGLADLAATPMRELQRLYLKKVDNGNIAHEDIDEFIEQKFNPYYSKSFSRIKESVKEIREQIPVTSNDISGSESLRELSLKGGEFAAESLPIMALFMLAPEAAIGATGLSVYGENLNNYQDIMKEVQDMDPSRRNFTHEGYRDLTLTRARGLSMAKGMSESALTTAFTYRYLKGLGGVTKRAGSVSNKEMIEIVNDYKRGFMNKFGHYGKSTRNELFEENLIALNNMFIDEISGTEDYTFDDYVKTVKNTSLGTMFSSAPLTFVAQNRRSRAAKSIVENVVAERFVNLDSKYKEMTSRFNFLSALAQKKLEEGGSSKILEEEIEKIAPQIVQEFADQRAILERADPEFLRRMVQEDLKIQELASEYKKAGDKTEKEIIKEQIKEALNNFRKNKDKINGADTLNTLTEMESVLQDVEVTEQQQQDKAFAVEPKTKFDEAMRSAANNLDAITTKLKTRMEELTVQAGEGSTKEEEGETPLFADEVGRTFTQTSTGPVNVDPTDQIEQMYKDNLFVSRPEVFNDVIRFLRNYNEGDMTTEQKSHVRKFLDSFSTENKGKFEENPDTAFENTDFPVSAGILSLYNYLHQSDQIVNDIASKKKVGTGKINPFSFIEGTQISKVFDGKLRMANNDHVISFLLKNEAMAQPLITLSRTIDSEYAKAIVRKKTEQEKYNNLTFLEGKVTKGRKEKFFSRANETERSFLAYLQKDVVDGQNYLQKKENLRKHLEERLATARKTSEQDVELATNAIEVFNRVVDPSMTVDELLLNADNDNVAGVDYFIDLFEKLNEGGRVEQFMRDFNGRVATQFRKYTPTLYDMDVAGAKETFSSDQIMRESESPNQFMEAADQVEIPNGASLVIDNFDNIMFNAFENSLGYLNTAELMAQYDGVIESKKFEQLFDQTQTFSHFGQPKHNKFNHAKEILRQKTRNIRNMQRSAKSNLVNKNAFTEAVKIVTKVAAAKRLAGVDMPLKQALSAMAGQLPVLGAEGRGFLISRMAAGGLFQGQKMTGYMDAILAESSTQLRGGLGEFQTEYLDQQKYFDKGSGFGQKAVDYGLGITDKAADFLMKNFLANSDKMAGMNTFLALYMDYDLKNNPEAREHYKSFDNYNEYWEWASRNINRKAIAHADNQVDRSQTQTTPWNQGGAFGSNQQDMPRVLSQMLFLFGRFAYNRKVGIANDISVLSSEQASKRDKDRARRRLGSAAVEIGVFKAISPTVSVIFAEAFRGMIAGLLGIDDELDKQIAHLESVGLSTAGMKPNKYQTSNYKREVGKEFATALVDGFIPLPTPQILNNLGFAIANMSAQTLGLTEDEIFSMYDPTLRNLELDNIGLLEGNDFLNYISNNSGIAQLAGEDLANLYNDAVFLSTGKLPRYNGLGKDRYVKDQALHAMRTLAFVNLMNTFMVPSADINRFQRQLRGVIYRDFGTTRKPIKSE